MKWLLLGCSLLVAGCETAQLTEAGMIVQPVQAAPAGCRMIATLRDAEGGGLRSFERNRSIVEARMRNEAARLGGDSLAVVDETRGDTDEGHILFATGAAGLTTPASRCNNCVALAAQVLQCSAHPPPPARPAPPRDDCTPSSPSPDQPAPDDEDWGACLRKRGIQRASAR
jgi:hypothetical protein